MSFIKESTAWQRIAQQLEGEDFTEGLCINVIEMHRAGKLSNTIRQRMLDRVATHNRMQPGGPSTYALPYGAVTERVIAANLLAFEASEEERALGGFGPSNAEYRRGIER